MKIIYQNENLAILNKPAGILVHPTKANEKNTIVDFIIKKWPTIHQNFIKQTDQSRIGIVHRLDKNTSGLIIIAKNPETQRYLQDQFKAHHIEKKYLALVLGKVMPENGEIITQISREKGETVRQKISSFTFSWDKNSKQAVTYYKTKKTFQFNDNILTLLDVEIKTGRMHQIRAQLKYRNWPVIGDQMYDTKESKFISDKLYLARQFLHSYYIKFKLPDGKLIDFKVGLPNDLSNIINNLKEINE